MRANWIIEGKTESFYKELAETYHAAVACKVSQGVAMDAMDNAIASVEENGDDKNDMVALYQYWVWSVESCLAFNAAPGAAEWFAARGISA